MISESQLTRKWELGWRRHLGPHANIPKLVSFQLFLAVSEKPDPGPRTSLRLANITGLRTSLR